MLVVQHFCQCVTRVPWNLQQKWLRCLFLVSKMNFRISYIFREGNFVADSLDKHEVRNTSFEWWDSAPHFCSHLICKDFSRQGAYCSYYALVCIVRLILVLFFFFYIYILDNRSVMLKLKGYQPS